MPNDLVPLDDKPEGLWSYYGKDFLPMVESAVTRVGLIMAAITAIAVGIEVSWIVSAVGMIVYVSCALLGGAYLDNQQLKATLRELRESRPTIRVEIINRPTWNEGQPPGSGLYKSETEWGLRIHNDGAIATFTAYAAVTENRSASRSHGPGMFPLRWERHRALAAELHRGTYDEIFFGLIERQRWDNLLLRVRTIAIDPHTEAPRVRWESAALQPDAQPRELFAEVEVTIAAIPELLDAPWCRRYRIGPDALTEVS